MSRVTVVDYGVGNLFNVMRALTFVGAHPKLATSAADIKNASRLLIPGVGAFAAAMAQFQAKPDLHEATLAHGRGGKPLLGICLGMQLLFEKSQEFGAHQGLGFLAGQVVEIPHTRETGEKLRVPHIGWSELVRSAADHVLMTGLPTGSTVYFVHSFYALPANEALRVADTMYGGHRLAAIVARENIMGCQFHPERSSETGLQILKNFVERT